MKYLSIPIIVMASCTMMLNAQSERSKTGAPMPGHNQNKADYIALDECIGAKVSMNPGAEALGEAADNKEAATRPIGEITDILINAKTGSMEWAVVSFGGVLGIVDKTVAMPCANLQWNAATKCYDADVSNDHLTALVAFDAEDAMKKGLDDTMTACAANWRTVVAPPASAKEAKEFKEASAKKAKQDASDKHADKQVVAVAGTTMIANPTRLLCASAMADYPLYARSDDFGTVSNCVVDRANGTLVFAIVGHGGTLGFGKDQYLLPFVALRLATKGEDAVLVVARSAKDIISSGKYEKPSKGIVDPEAAKRCCASVVAKADVDSKDHK